jgi:hypothetical protein
MEQEQHAQLAQELDPTSELHKQFEVWAGDNSGRTLPFELLRFDPNAFRGQALGEVFIPANKASTFDIIHGYAIPASGEKHPKRFETMVRAFSARQDLLNNILLDIADGKNIAVISGHGEMQDIPLIQAALICALDDEGLIPHNGIVVNKMLSRLGIYGLPTLEVLSYLGNTFLSIPRSKKALATQINSDTADKENKLMLRRMRRFMQKGGRIIAMAPSGSTDVRVENGNGDVSEIIMQRMSSGTADQLTKFDRVLPVAAWLQSDEDSCVEIGQLQEVQTHQEAHELMKWIAVQTIPLAGLPVRYESHEERQDNFERIRNFGKGIVEKVEHAIHHQ